MEKTTVYLSSEQKTGLADRARAEGRSEARLIRDGIDAVLARHRAGEAVTPLEAGTAPSSAGHAPPLARPRWIDRDVFVARLLDAQADPALRRDLRELAPDMTDALPDR